MTAVIECVCEMIARHANCHASSIHAQHDLGRDLGLTPLQIAQVAVEIEDFTESDIAGGEFACVRTVGDLFSLVVRHMAPAS